MEVDDILFYGQLKFCFYFALRTGFISCNDHMQENYFGIYYDIVHSDTEQGNIQEQVTSNRSAVGMMPLGCWKTT